MKKSRDARPKVPDYEHISYKPTDEHTLEKVATPHVRFSLTAEKFRNQLIERQQQGPAQTHGTRVQSQR